MKKKFPYRFSTRLLHLTARTYFSTLGQWAPDLSAKLGIHLWGRTSRPKWRDWEQQILAKARRTDLKSGRHRIATYCWGDGDKKILLIHGWNSRASHFRNYIASLTRRGYCIVGFDAIGHGHSDGNWTNILQYLEVIQAVRQQYGDFYAVIGHSFGGFSIPKAINDGLVYQKAVLLGTPDSMAWLFDRFVDMAHIHPRIVHAMRERVSHMLGRTDWEYYSPLNNAPQLAHIDALILIDQDDAAIEVTSAEKLQKCWPNSRLVVTRGLGHQKILRHRHALKPVLKFIGEDP